MQKKFLKNLGLLIFLNLLVKPFWILGIDRQVQNAVGPEEYGLYFFLFNFSFLFYIFLDLGITNFNNRNIAQNNQLLNKHLSGISMLKLVLGVLYAILIIIGGILWGYRGRELYILSWLGFNQFILSFILYLRSNLSGLLLFKTDSLISVLDRVLMILIVGFLLWFNLFEGLFTIEWFVYSQTAAYLITFAVAIIAVLNKSGKLKFNWNLPFFLLIAKRSAPFALLVLIMSFYNRIDPVLIERLLPESIGKEQVGIYAQGYRLLDAGQNFSFLFAVLLLPIFAKMISAKQSVENLIKLSASMLISGALIIAIITQFYAYNIMELMYNIAPDESQQHYLLRISQSATVLKLLMFSFVGISSNYIFGTLLTANHNLKQLNIIAIGGLVINLSLNLLLIPYYQSIGSAYASIATQCITAILQLLLVYKVFKFNKDFKTLISMVLLVGLLYLIGYLLHETVLIRWELSVVVMLISGLIISIALKLLNIKEFILIIKSKE
jgi:O-antigen/teichoic acid export membrane protein